MGQAVTVGLDGHSDRYLQFGDFIRMVIKCRMAGMRWPARGVSDAKN